MFWCMWILSIVHQRKCNKYKTQSVLNEVVHFIRKHRSSSESHFFYSFIYFFIGLLVSDLLVRTVFFFISLVWNRLEWSHTPGFWFFVLSFAINKSVSTNTYRIYTWNYVSSDDCSRFNSYRSLLFVIKFTSPKYAKSWLLKLICI